MCQRSSLYAWVLSACIRLFVHIRMCMRAFVCIFVTVIRISFSVWVHLSIYLSICVSVPEFQIHSVSVPLSVGPRRSSICHQSTKSRQSPPPLSPPRTPGLLCLFPRPFDHVHGQTERVNDDWCMKKTRQAKVSLSPSPFPHPPLPFPRPPLLPIPPPSSFSLCVTHVMRTTSHFLMSDEDCEVIVVSLYSHDIRSTWFLLSFCVYYPAFVIFL